MLIDLNQQMEEHLQRVTELAEEAANDGDQGFQSRSSAMSACSTMLVQLTKAQESLVTMERLNKVEQIIIDTVKEYLSEQQLEHVLAELEKKLEALA